MTAARSRHAALSGSQTKAPGFAGGYLLTLVDAQAQVRLRGTVTDEWGNGLEGTRVILQRAETTTTRDTMTEEDGTYQFISVSVGEYTIEFHAEGYQAIRSPISARVTDTRPIDIELEALPFGSRFRDDTKFEAEGGTPRIAFDRDGKFEFKDANGEGEGTYGIDALSVVMIVRDYDGPDDSYSVSESVVVTSPDDQFTGLTWGETALMKK